MPKRDPATQERRASNVANADRTGVERGRRRAERPGEVTRGAGLLTRNRGRASWQQSVCGQASRVTRAPDSRFGAVLGGQLIRSQLGKRGNPRKRKALAAWLPFRLPASLLAGVGAGP